MQNITGKYAIYYIPVIFLFLLFLFTFYKVNDPFFLLGIISCILFFFTIYRKIVHFTIFDIGVILLFFYELALHVTTVNIETTSLYLIKIFQVFIYYFLVRFLIRTKRRITAFLSIHTLFFCFLMLIALYAFNRFSISVWKEGFDNLYDFRFRYRPLGIHTNIWGEYILIFGGMIVCAFNFCKRKAIRIAVIIPSLILVLYSVIISFSRGAYISFFIFSFIILIPFFKLKIGQGYKFGVIIEGILLIFLFVKPYFKEVNRAVSMVETVSQQRSLEERGKVLPAIGKIVREYPVMGVGTGNYTLALNEYRFENDNNIYTSYAPNVFALIIVEKGILGLLLWVALGIVFIWQFIHISKKDIMAYIILATITAILGKEFSYPILLLNFPLLMLFFGLIAIFQNLYISNAVISIQGKYIAFIPVTIAVLFSYITVIKYRNEQFNNEFIAAFRGGDLDIAGECIMHTDNRTPYLINKAVWAWEKYKGSKKETFLQIAENNLRLATKRNSLDIMVKHNLAIVLNEKGKRDSALLILKELTKKYPDKALYRLSLSALLYKENREEAITGLIESIKLSPNILETFWWKNLSEKDTIGTKKIKSELLSYARQREKEQPITMAKKARLLLSLGDTLTAEKYLEEVLETLPNLSRPWYYLGVIAFARNEIEKGIGYMKRSEFLDSADDLPKYWLDLYNKNKMNGLVYNNINFLIKEDYSFLSNGYIFKFQDWYRVKSIAKNIVFINNLKE